MADLHDSKHASLLNGSSDYAYTNFHGPIRSHGDIDTMQLSLFIMMHVLFIRHNSNDISFYFIA